MEQYYSFLYDSTGNIIHSHLSNVQGWVNLPSGQTQLVIPAEQATADVIAANQNNAYYMVQNGAITAKTNISALQLVDAQAAKLAQINSDYISLLNSSFKTTALGSNVTFNYKDEDQKKFDKLLAVYNAGIVQYPVYITDNDGTLQEVQNATQLINLYKDLMFFEQGLETKLQKLAQKIKGYTTINQVNFIDMKDFAPPAIPAGLAYASGTLTWTANTDADLEGYNVYQSTDGTMFTKINSTEVAANSYTVSGLIAGTTYYFAITAVDVNTNESAKCTAIKITA